MVSRLLEANANVEAADKNGSTALILSADMGHAEVVGLLLGAGGANVEAVNEDGDTPLIISACNGHAEVVARLLEANANVEAADKYGLRPLLLLPQKATRRWCRGC
mmetsp:Transcript_26085/g.83232  ORF Transcript_26085/g.83232 Transcript_26085/m.83232 type:complete len:106 (+) Transcript_26085:863-1180(+)